MQRENLIKRTIMRYKVKQKATVHWRTTESKQQITPLRISTAVGPIQCFVLESR